MKRAVLERVRRNSQQLVLKLDALMLSARKADLDRLERLSLTTEVELAMRYLSVRGSTSFAIDIGADVYANARSAVLRYWQAGALVFAGQDAEFANVVLSELLAVVCARDSLQIIVTAARIRLVFILG